jgi:hypothetical protein
MKNYFLTIFGNFKEKGILEEILSLMSPVVDSPRIKFQRMNNCVLMHFGTEVHQEEIYYFLEGGMNELYTGFVLTENNSGVMINFPKIVKDHLLDLDSVDEKNEKIIKINLSQPDFDETRYQEYEINPDDYLDFPSLTDFLKNKTFHIPTLDELLEKIKQDGINSLNKEEINLLENYSKN